MRYKRIAAGLLLTTIAHAAVAADLTIGAFGGIWEDSLKECAVTPFEKTSGKTIDIVLGTPVQWLNQIKANPSKPPLDIVFLPSDNAFEAATSGLMAKFTPENVPNMAQLRPYFAEIGKGYGVVHNYGSMGVIYNKTTVKNPPKTWKEFIAGTLAGKWTAAMPSINYPGATSTDVWNFAQLEGGSVDNIQPGLDIIKKMKASGNLVFWTDPNQVLNGMKSGEFDIAMYWDGRAWAFMDDPSNKGKFGYLSPEPGAVAAMTWVQVAKNANPISWQFVNYLLSDKVQGCFGSSVRYGVGNAHAQFNPAVKDEITDYSKLIFPPFAPINKLQGQWIEAWNKQIGG